MYIYEILIKTIHLGTNLYNLHILMLEVVLNEKEQKSLHIWLKFQTSLIYFSSRINSLKETIHFRMHRIEGQPTYSLKSLITFFVSKKKKSKRLLSLLATVNLHFFLIPLNK